MKKITFLFTLLFLPIVYFSSCKKDAPNSPPDKDGTIPTDTETTVSTITITNLTPQEDVIYGKELTIHSTIANLSKVDVYIDNKLKTGISISALKYTLSADSLPDNTQHTIYVKGTSASGTTYNSPIIIFNGFHLSPINLSLKLSGTNAVDLQWQDLSTKETGFIVERKDSLTNTYTTLATLPPSPNSNGVIDYKDASITTSAIKYTYRVKAIAGLIKSDATNIARLQYISSGTTNFSLATQIASPNLIYNLGHAMFAFAGSQNEIVKFSKDGKYFLLLVQKFDGTNNSSTIEIYDAQNYSLLRTITQTAANGADYTAVFSNDNQYIIAGGYYDNLKVYKTADGTLARTITHTAPATAIHAKCTISIDISSDGSLIAADEGKSVGIYNFTTGALVKSITPSFTYPSANIDCSVKFDHSGTKLLIGQKQWIDKFPANLGNNEVQLYNYQTGLYDHTLITRAGTGDAGYFSLDDTKIVTPQLNPYPNVSSIQLSLFNSNSSSVDLAIKETHPFAAFSLDGSQVFAFSFGTEYGINAVDANTGAKLATFQSNILANAANVDYDPLSGKMIVIGNLLNVINTRSLGGGTAAWYVFNY